MGHDSHDHGHEKTNPHAIQEADNQLPLRIRSIDFIKHNPNIFHVGLGDVSTGLEILGGNAFLASAFAGASFGWWYFGTKARINPVSFYANIMLSFSRIFLGGVVGGFFGYLRFGDRQRLHNAWVSERLRRRYPESMTLDKHDLWRFKGVKPTHTYYKWT